MKSVRRSTLAFVSMLAIVGLLFWVVAGLPSCSTLASLKASLASGKISEQIAYYDKYVEGAKTWASIVLPFIPLPPAASPAIIGALTLVDAALDKAKTEADAYAAGKAPQIVAAQALLDVKTTVQEFNALVGQVQANKP